MAEEEDYVKNIKLLINSIKRNPEDPKVFQLADTILSICKKIENKDLAKSIKDQIIIMINTIDVALRLQAIEIIDQLLKMPKKEEKGENSFISSNAKIVEKKAYTSFKNKCDPDMLKSIEATEEKIQNFPFLKKLHEPIKTGQWKNFLHAWVQGYKDLRIVYLWDPHKKVLIFYYIGTHKELGIN